MTIDGENSTDDVALEVITAALLVIGDEILSGRTADKNIHSVASRCTLSGLQLREVRVVGDEEVEIITALQALAGRYHYVFTTGGIGPTHDDITADCVAKAFDVPLLEHPEAVQILLDHYPHGGLTDARRRMTRIPEGGVLIANSISAAPGFMIENVIVMAGVPKIVEVMLDDVFPKLRTGRKMLSIAVQISQPESRVAGLLADLDKRYEAVSIGSYPFFREGNVGATVVLRGLDREMLEEVVGLLTTKLEEKGYEFVMTA